MFLEIRKQRIFFKNFSFFLCCSLELWFLKNIWLKIQFLICAENNGYAALSIGFFSQSATVAVF